MKFIADFHIHSKYSRATSKSTDLDNIAKYAKIKGVDVMGTGDFTHYLWIKEIKEKIEPCGNGVFCIKGDPSLKFVLTSEISCIYTKNGKTRKIHVVVFAPSIEIVEEINAKLGNIGNIRSDGRPILGIDAKELLKIIMSVSSDCFFVPAHCLTPWFSIFGSKSGFDSVEECFEEETRHIYALESGLSADPSMIWKIPDGRKLSIISNSDAHSGEKIGREANVFNTEMDYYSIIDAIKSKDPLKFLYTIEFYPEEGKYHYDGHRDCKISLSPEESRKYNELCPACGKPLTIGVLNRVEVLSKGDLSDKLIPFKKIVPLKEIISECLGVGVLSKAVKKEYDKLIDLFKSEFKILLDVPLEEIEDKIIREGIKRVREGDLSIAPGFDGEFGKVSIFSKQEVPKKVSQKILF
ncbi:MAG TPA: endonuclease Q family protein [Candidatus Pacearchaeota archaeon]|nr:endonuclease Q family protein [Candidatus Pacearchaeota archaeon]HQM24594.1 endonuclease Q family protein [Candidatus Pacearchaeota archaeon]